MAFPAYPASKERFQVFDVIYVEPRNEARPNHHGGVMAVEVGGILEVFWRGRCRQITVSRGRARQARLALLNGKEIV